MKFIRLASLVVLALSFSFLYNCSSDSDDDEIIAVVEENEEAETIEPETEIEEEPEVETEDPISEPEENNTEASLSERFIFNSNLVIEHSYNTGGCDSPPCDTEEDNLGGNIFANSLPDDPYFYLSVDQSELNLECQLEKGRRAEFKQISEGPLTTFSRLELEGIYYDIPNNGVTIAQVHNRGGSSNKPFFRLVLHNDGLETVIRKDPEVSSSLTSFQKEDFPFEDGGNYDLSTLKVTVEKSNGLVHINVVQHDVTILDESYAADPTTDWVNDSGIANGYYLKGGLYNDDGPHTENLIVGYSRVEFQSDDN